MALKDITLGQYFPGESKIHKLDARTKILGVLVFIVGLFCANSFTGLAISLAAIAIVIAMSGVPFSFIVRGIKPVLVLIVFTMIVNLFMTPGTILFQLGFLKITDAGLYRSAFMAIRLIMLIFGSSLLTLTTKPLQLTDGMEKLLSPLRKIGVPAHELAMIMSIALRFIPTLMEEADKIMKAQTSRGADFESGNVIQRAKSLIPVLVPLFVSAFRIAADLANAMEARCYRGGEGRTRMNALKFRGADFLAMFLFAVYVAACIGSRSLNLF